MPYDSHATSCLRIGGLAIHTSAGEASISGPDDPVYDAFRCDLPSADAADISVALNLTPAPPQTGFNTVFRGGNAWTLSAKGAMRRIEFAPPTMAEPLWVARFARDCRTVTVHCGAAIVDQTTAPTTILNPMRYPLDQLILTHALAQRDGLLLHAAAFEFAGQAYVFPGKSGAGKSTLTRELANIPGITMLSDDRVLLRRGPDGLRVHGTPWPGEARIAVDCDLPLAGLLFIQQANTNRIVPIAKNPCDRLLPCLSILWYDSELLPAMLGLAATITESIPVLELQFTRDGAIGDECLRWLAQDGSDS